MRSLCTALTLFLCFAGCHTPPPAANNTTAKTAAENSIGLLLRQGVQFWGHLLLIAFDRKIKESRTVTFIQSFH